MTFQELKDHCEDFGCHVDHFEDHLYWASNCVNFHICLIEDLEHYSYVTICHYCLELGIPAPNEFLVEMEEYRQLRDHIHGVVSAEENEESEE